MVDRRGFMAQGAAFAALCGAGDPPGDCRRSVYKGIPIGAITYSYNTMPIGRFKTLEYVKGSGLSEIELMCNDLEVDAGSPMRRPWKAMSQGERAEVVKWRRDADPGVFAAVRGKYDDAGVGVHIVKFPSIGGSIDQSDSDLEYCFRAAKAMGAGAITREIPKPETISEWEPIARRVAKFAEKYDIAVAFHNHLQINATTYDGPLLGWSPKFMINFDIGHYVAANDDDPLAFVRKYHDRIFSVHLKDRTSTAHGRKDLPFGTGDTPLNGLFALMLREGWRFYCDVELEYKIPAGSDAVREVDACRKYCMDSIGRGAGMPVSAVSGVSGLRRQ